MPTQSFSDYVEALERDPAELKALDQARARVSVGRRLRELREAHGLSQRALAVESGVTQSDICRIDRRATDKGSGSENDG